MPSSFGTVNGAVTGNNITEEFFWMQQPTGKKSRADLEFLSRIGERIAEARGEMSQERFAAKVGRSTRTLSAWEGGSNLSVLDLKKVAEASGRNLLWLLTGSGPWKSEKPAPPLVREAEEQAYLSENRPDEDAPGDGLKGLVDPRHMPPEESSKTLAGYFDFGDRVIRASLLLEAYGPPARLGRYSSEEPRIDKPET